MHSIYSTGGQISTHGQMGVGIGCVPKFALAINSLSRRHLEKNAMQPRMADISCKRHLLLPTAVVISNPPAPVPKCESIT